MPVPVPLFPRLPLNGSLRPLAALVMACVLAAGTLPAADPVPPPPGPVVALPKMTVVGQMLKDYPFFPRSEVTPPAFAPSSAPVDLNYPGAAYTEGVSEGSATVGVMLDETGKPTDFLLLRYTKRYFGDALLREARRQQYTPREVRGVAVPGRFNLGTRFTPTVALQMNSFNAIEERDIEIQGGPKMIYAPHLERELDAGELQSVRGAVALLPSGYEAPKGKTVKAFVSFYVDEQGRVRLPNVESAASPLLIPHALKAVAHWQFKPPTVRGQPALIFTLWTVTFVSEGAPVAAPR